MRGLCRACRANGGVLGVQVVNIVAGVVSSWQKNKMYKEAVVLLRLLVRRDQVKCFADAGGFRFQRRWPWVRLNVSIAESGTPFDFQRTSSHFLVERGIGYAHTKGKPRCSERAVISGIVSNVQ